MQLGQTKGVNASKLKSERDKINTIYRFMPGSLENIRGSIVKILQKWGNSARFKVHTHESSAFIYISKYPTSKA